MHIDNQPETQQTKDIRYICRHIFTDGHRCASPALRNQDFCYYHHTTRQPVAGKEARTRKLRRNEFILPRPEDRTAVQLSIGEVLDRIATNRIDPKRAGLLLYGLQTASANLARTNFSPYPKDMVIDPATVRQTPLNGHVWDDTDFDGIEEDDEEKETEPEQKKAKIMQRAGEPSRKQEKANVERQTPKAAAPPASLPPKRPSANVDMNQVRTKITNQIRQALPDLAGVLAHKANGKSAG